MGGGERSKGEGWAPIDQDISFFFFSFMRWWWDKNAAFRGNTERRHVNAWFGGWFNQVAAAATGTTVVVILD